MTILGKIAEKLHLKSPAPKEESTKSETDMTKGPAFDSSKITVIFVLGGPGAGASLQLTWVQASDSSLACRQRNTVRKTRRRVRLLPFVW